MISNIRSVEFARGIFYHANQILERDSLGIWFRPPGWCLHPVTTYLCILYRRQNWSAEILKGLSQAQSRQRTKHSLQSSELGLTHSFTRRRVCTPTPFGSGGKHIRLRERGWGGGGGGPNSDEGTRHCGDLVINLLCGLKRLSDGISDILYLL